MLFVRVYVSDPNGGRRPVECELIRRNKKSLVVKLPNGKVVKRRLVDLLLNR